MPSFDIVSRLDLQEIDNAIANSLREIGQRYDFKQSKTSIERQNTEIKIITDDEMKLKQVNDIIITHFVRRKIDPQTIKIKSTEKALGNSIRQIYDLVQGIDQQTAKKITKSVKDSNYWMHRGQCTGIFLSRADTNKIYFRSYFLIC